MSIKSLAEGIILQSLEDIWDTELSSESIDFFRGGDFRTCAEMAGMSLLEQVKLLNMVKGVVDRQKRSIPVQTPAVRRDPRRRSISRSELSCPVR